MGPFFRAILARAPTSGVISPSHNFLLFSLLYEDDDQEIYLRLFANWTGEKLERSKMMCARRRDELGETLEARRSTRLTQREPRRDDDDNDDDDFARR